MAALSARLLRRPLMLATDDGDIIVITHLKSDGMTGTKSMLDPKGVMSAGGWTPMWLTKVLMPERPVKCQHVDTASRIAQWRDVT